MIGINGVQSTFLNTLIGGSENITSDTAGVAASLNTLITVVTTDGDQNEDNVTLADGVEGQVKIIIVASCGDALDTLKITPATLEAGAWLELNGTPPNGQGVVLVWVDPTGWVVAGQFGIIQP